ncbi:MAG: hypothetical protein QM756_01055 [Polyangiaceae bacterium]
MARLVASIVAGMSSFALLAAHAAGAYAAVENDAAAEATRPIVAEAPKDTLSHPLSDGEPTRAPESLSLGGRAFIAPTVGIGAMGLGLDEAYSVLPNLAIGGQYLTYAVDQGADPQYCERCIRDGKAALVFAEGRLWQDSWFTPYARAGGGLSFVNGQRVAYETGYGETDATLLAEAGVELHHRWFSSRLFGFHLQIVGSELDWDPFTGLGTQLGARF